VSNEVCRMATTALKESKMANPLLDDLQQIDPNWMRLARCQVDVSFRSGYKTRSQPHCTWYRDYDALPQIIEVTDTGWETYHFKSLPKAQAFAEETKRRVADATFAAGRLPAGAEITIQLRATIEVARDVVARVP